MYPSRHFQISKNFGLQKTYSTPLTNSKISDNFLLLSYIVKSTFGSNLYALLLSVLAKLERRL